MLSGATGRRTDLPIRSDEAIKSEDPTVPPRHTYTETYLNGWAGRVEDREGREGGEVSGRSNLESVARYSENYLYHLLRISV